MDNVESMLEKEFDFQFGQYKVESYQECPEIFDAIEYAFKVGGKRLRPKFMYASYRMFSPKKNKSEEEIAWGDSIITEFMLAIELIHTFSLIHDDMPAIDNDELRRGKESVWKKHGEAIALLSGDALIYMAASIIDFLRSDIFDLQDALLEWMIDHYKKLSNREIHSFCSYINKFIRELCDRIEEARAIIFSQSGLDGLIIGEARDTISDKTNWSLEDYYGMYAEKTGALFAASLEVGAILGGANEYERNVIRQAGFEIGIAFQIQDDILDIISTTEVLGKPVHSDAKNDKRTIVDILGLDGAKREYEMRMNRALGYIHDLSEENSNNDRKYDELPLRNLILTLFERKF